MKNLLKRMRIRSRPSQESKKRIDKELRIFTKKIKKRIKDKGFGAEVFVGGSYAKNTWLHDPEIDIFVMFEPGTKRISEKLRELLKGIGFEEIKGSRNYYKVGRYELVPILKIKHQKQAENITDYSPLHVEYINENLENPDDVRLLKLFCMSAGIYGAEDHVSGFSGYVLELLVSHFGSFESLIRAAENWEPKVYIDPGKKYRSRKSALDKLPKSKKKSPIILIDPTQKKRNAAAGLDYKSFSKFVFNARKFIKNPSEEFFKIHELTKKELRNLSKKRGNRIFFRNIRPVSPKKIFFSKLKKKIEKIKSSLDKQGFSVYDYGFTNDFVYFELNVWKTSGTKKHTGPFVWAPKKHFNAFMKKWKEVYVDGNNLATDRKTFSKAGNMIKHLFEEHSI